MGKKSLKADDTLKNKFDDIGFSENWDGSKVVPVKVLIKNDKNLIMQLFE